jgi:hypothetical protein
MKIGYDEGNVSSQLRVLRTARRPYIYKYIHIHTHTYTYTIRVFILTFIVYLTTLSVPQAIFCSILYCLYCVFCIVLFMYIYLYLFCLY